MDFPIPCQFQTGEDIIDFYAMDVVRGGGKGNLNFSGGPRGVNLSHRNISPSLQDNMTRDIIMLGVMFVVLRVAGLLVLYARAYRRNK